MDKLKLVSLTAGLVLAMVFTLSCSSDDGGSPPDGGGTQGGVSSSSDGEEQGGGSSSSSEDTQASISSSSDGEEQGGGSSSSSEDTQASGSSSSEGSESTVKITKSKISGVSQKGPFVEGSTVTLYELNDEFAQTGRSFKSIIADNKGSFEIRGVELISPYAMLEASGYYRNEVTGQLSKSPITLFAIADVREKDNFNVNLLTHLEYYRVLNLAESGKDVAEAKKQAQEEILAVFGIDGNFENSEDMNIFGATEGDAALLAISVLLQGNLSEGEFSQRLTNFAQSIKESGKWENETAKTAIADWASAASLAGIRSNITSWGLSSEAPDFEKYVTDYWTTAYSLGGCASANDDEIKKDNRDIYRICKTGNWVVASELEYDTYQWNCSTANEGEIKAGDVSGKYYVCENKVWRTATSVETDVQSVCLASNEGKIETGNISDKEYVCKYGNWQGASYKDKYCFENKNGRINDRCSYFTDDRDKQRYAYVVIEVRMSFMSGYPGNIRQQTWMAENLNYNSEGSKCYGNLNSNCEIYGRLYNWQTAKTACPSGWHLPTMDEWKTMIENTVGGGGGINFDVSKLKAKSGWYDNGNGTDDYGFSALPGGYGHPNGGFDYVGKYGNWWSASELGNDYAYQSYIYYGRNVPDLLMSEHGVKVFLRSVRCVQDY
jgi:uncharacterized protein (TIGR02145 family)